MGSGLRGIAQDWLLPRPRSHYRGLELRRCRTDGQLISMDKLEPHAGHTIASPVILTLREKVLIWLKLIR